jgi:hypothetical protein
MTGRWLDTGMRACVRIRDVIRANERPLRDVLVGIHSCMQ